MAAKSAKRILTALVFCTVFFITVIFYHHIDVYLKNVNYLLASAFLLVIFICIAVLLVKGIRKIVTRRTPLTFKGLLPTIIYVVTLLLTYLVPGSEGLDSKPVLTAYHKGTQSKADVKFMENKTFELHLSGMFGSNRWYTGSYQQKGDTIFLKYKDDVPAGLSKKAVKQDGLLTFLPETASDSSSRPVEFKIYHGTLK